MPSQTRHIRSFLRSLGPVEQAQVVASTGVVVMMGTILLTIVITQESIRLMDFISILTVGLIGYASVYFSVRNSARLDAHRRQLIAMNSIADAVARLTEIDDVLRTALEKVAELLGNEYGWIYILENDRLALKASRGTDTDFLSLTTATEPSAWLHQPRVEREKTNDRKDKIHPRLKSMGIQFWASVPLRAKEDVAGTLVVAGRNFNMLTPQEAEIVESFGKQINTALSNARLFGLLRRSEEQYHDLFENAPDSYLSVNRERVIVSCNKAGELLFGSKRDVLLGKRFEDLFLQERNDDVREKINTMFSTGIVVNDLEEQVASADGEKVFVNLKFSLALDHAGVPVSARVIARDISQRKRMEEAVFHAQKIDTIGQLAGGVAHDFNNILASVLGAASIMRRRLTEKAKLYKYVEIIEVAARRGSSLTRQLLTFARKTETHEETVDVNSVVSETIALFERSTPKNIVVRRILTEEPAIIRGDSGQVQQAILNLFLNARDAMPEGGTLTVSSDVVMADAHTTSRFTSVKPGPFVRIRVTDTGLGIDRSIQQRIFEPFFTTKNTGTGLGLSVLYGVIQSHGGFVDLESEPGRGSTFSVYFPRQVEQLQAVLRNRRQRIPRGSEHILVVDDEVSVCEVARDMLSDLGYTVISAPDGKSGVDQFRRRQATIDLVLLDINMPLMDGKETLAHLRAINPRVNVILLTGYGEHDVQQTGVLSDVDSFLQKPFHLEDLAMKVRQVLDSKKTAPEFVP